MAHATTRWLGWLTLAAGLGPAGCALMIGSYAEYTPLATATCALARAPGAGVEIVTSGPSVPHVETGLFEVNAVGSGAQGTQTALALIRQEAAARGCHVARLGGITVKPGDHYHSYNDPVLNILDLIATDPKDRKLVTATCIVLRDPECRNEQPPGRLTSRPRPRARPAPVANTPGPPLACRARPSWTLARAPGPREQPEPP
jgi:hypothetical protein